MPRRRLMRRVSPIWLAFTVYDVYRRLPPKQRKQVLLAVRRHGPTVASKAFQLYAGARRRRR